MLLGRLLLVVVCLSGVAARCDEYFITVNCPATRTDKAGVQQFFNQFWENQLVFAVGTNVVGADVRTIPWNFFLSQMRQACLRVIISLSGRAQVSLLFWGPCPDAKRMAISNWDYPSHNMVRVVKWELDDDCSSGELPVEKAKDSECFDNCIAPWYELLDHIRQPNIMTPHDVDRWPDAVEWFQVAYGIEVPRLDPCFPSLGFFHIASPRTDCLEAIHKLMKEMESACVYLCQTQFDQQRRDEIYTIMVETEETIRLTQLTNTPDPTIQIIGSSPVSVLRNNYITGIAPPSPEYDQNGDLPKFIPAPQEWAPAPDLIPLSPKPPQHMSPTQFVASDTLGTPPSPERVAAEMGTPRVADEKGTPRGHHRRRHRKILIDGDGNIVEKHGRRHTPRVEPLGPAPDVATLDPSPPRTHGTPRTPRGEGEQREGHRERRAHRTPRDGENREGHRGEGHRRRGHRGEGGVEGEAARPRRRRHRRGDKAHEMVEPLDPHNLPAKLTIPLHPADILGLPEYRFSALPLDGVLAKAAVLSRYRKLVEALHSEHYKGPDPGGAAMYYAALKPAAIQMIGDFSMSSI